MFKFTEAIIGNDTGTVTVQQSQTALLVTNCVTAGVTWYLMKKKYAQSRGLWE